MDEPGSSVTLLNRVESHGQKFPWFLEKLIFLLAILGALLLGQWMWVESGCFGGKIEKLLIKFFHK